MINFQHDFKTFFLANNISHLALGVIMGNAGAVLIKSFMNNIIVPIISSFQNISPQKWKNRYITILGAEIKLRLFLSDLFTFILTLVVTFIFIQYITKPLLKLTS